MNGKSCILYSETLTHSQTIMQTAYGHKHMHIRRCFQYNDINGIICKYHSLTACIINYDDTNILPLYSYKSNLMKVEGNGTVIIY